MQYPGASGGRAGPDVWRGQRPGQRTFFTACRRRAPKEASCCPDKFQAPVQAPAAAAPSSQVRTPEPHAGAARDGLVGGGEGTGRYKILFLPCKGRLANGPDTAALGSPVHGSFSFSTPEGGRKPSPAPPREHPHSQPPAAPEGTIVQALGTCSQGTWFSPGTGPEPPVAASTAGKPRASSGRRAGPAGLSWEERWCGWGPWRESTGVRLRPRPHMVSRGPLGTAQHRARTSPSIAGCAVTSCACPLPVPPTKLAA